MKIPSLIIPFLLLYANLALAQTKLNTTDAEQKSQLNNRSLIQFSGVVVEVDSLRPIPFTNIFVKHTQHGTVADYFGYFSFVAQKGDTLIFSEVGYAKAQFIIPDTLSNNRYSLIQMLRKDTITLRAIEVFSWPTREQFKQVFMSLHSTEDDIDRARKNLSYDNMKELYNTLPMDGSMNYKYNIEQRYSRLYATNLYPSYSILNPIAWAQFIQAWKRGDFKRKD
ncbi:MAG: carboxypeptidase-like regulatory domain-containing protein [Bacteroidia bacterium]|nr:carboxypeptidase-like regulatory domain-containing protein [Bacteroidia bacterium]